MNLQPHEQYSTSIICPKVKPLQQVILSLKLSTAKTLIPFSSKAIFGHMIKFPFSLRLAFAITCVQTAIYNKKFPKTGRNVFVHEKQN